MAWERLDWVLIGWYGDPQLCAIQPKRCARAVRSDVGSDRREEMSRIYFKLLGNGILPGESKGVGLFDIDGAQASAAGDTLVKNM